MPITPTHLYTTRSNADQSSYVSPTNLTPSANKLVVGFVSSRITSGTINLPTVTGGGVTTWNIYDSFRRSSNLSCISVVYGLSGATPGSAQITFDFGGQTQLQCDWSFSEYAGTVQTGTNGVDAFVQSSKGDTSSNANTYSRTLATFAGVDNLAVGAFHAFAQRTVTAIPPAVLLGSTSGTGENTTFVSVYDSAVTIGAQFTGTNTGWMAIAVELAAQMTGGGPVVQYAPYRLRGFNGRLN